MQQQEMDDAGYQLPMANFTLESNRRQYENCGAESKPKLPGSEVQYDEISLKPNAPTMLARNEQDGYLNLRGLQALPVPAQTSKHEASSPTATVNNVFRTKTVTMLVIFAFVVNIVFTTCFVVLYKGKQDNDTLNDLKMMKAAVSSLQISIETLQFNNDKVPEHIETLNATERNASTSDKVLTSLDGVQKAINNSRPEIIAESSRDFAECGQAGDVGGIKKQARLRRSVGGEDAAENAWPWQALITRKAFTLKQSLSNKFMLLGGGSIINEHWILTAANLLAREEKQDEGWTNIFMVSVGIFERPRSNGEVKKSVQAYSIGKYVEHQSFSKQTLDNDIALIRLGSRLDYNMSEIPGTDKGLTFGYSIRPVCLPCTGTCLKREQLINEDGVSLITDDMSDEQKCRVEEKFLLSKHAKAVVTGFGYVNRSMRNNYDRDRRFNPARKLQQALLKVDKKANCDTGIKDIIERRMNSQLRFTENMICFTSGIADRIVDACKGDSGGPVVREVKAYHSKKSCWVQIGIVSFGYGCGREDIPGYYTNVARYLSWINETTNGILSGY